VTGELLVDLILLMGLATILAIVTIAGGSVFYFNAKEAYVDRLISKRKGNEYGD
jgi:hypothetical protein